MPDIYNALLVDTTVGGETRTMTMEVALQIGDNMVRAIALKPTDGMQRGAEVRDTGAPDLGARSATSPRATSGT